MRFSASIPLLLLLIASGSDDTEARLCVGGRTNEQHFAGSQAVFLGRARGQQVLQGAAGRAETETTFEIDRQWKGEPRPTIAVRTCGAPGEWCEHKVSFEPGQAYVVFASGTPLRTSACSLTSTAEAGIPVVTWLEQRAF